MTKTYDAIVIGTGQAGPFLTARLTAAGMKVAVIERKLFEELASTRVAPLPRLWSRVPMRLTWLGARPISE